MTLEIGLTLGITLVVVVLLVSQRLPVDMVAILTVVLVAVFGLVEPVDALSGFSNPATITVLCMFILSESVARTGVLELVGQQILGISGKSKRLALFLMILFVGVVSMFINNTAAVALLIPIALQISSKTGWCTSSLLMPISFASMAGGVCTLIGTSTNLLADSVLKYKGFSGFTMFSFFEYGIVFFGLSIFYILLFSEKLIPMRRESEDQDEYFDMKNYLTTLKVNEGSQLIGESIDDSETLEEMNIMVINKISGKHVKSDMIEEGDILFVETPIAGLENAMKSNKLEIVSDRRGEVAPDGESLKSVIVETVLAADSELVKKRLPLGQLYREFGVKVLAVRHHSVVEHSALKEIRLKAGDSILMSCPKKNLERLRRSKLFVVVSKPELQVQMRDKIPHALAIMAAVVVPAALGWIPIYISSMIGISLFVLTKIIKFEEIYSMVNWKVIFLLAGLIALGEAMEDTGTAEYLSNFVVTNLMQYGLAGVVGGYFLLTLILTSVMSNNASVVLMAPLAIYSARDMGVSPETLVLPVMFAGSMSFLTPIGYQTNMMVYGVGQYKFSDFIRFGGPLCLICLGLAIYIFS